MKCFECHSEMLAGHVEHALSVSGVKIRGNLPAMVCPSCGENTVEADALSAFEIMAAHALAQYAVRTAEAFRFMRKALGLRATDLAELLGANAATISRWENGHIEVDRLAYALVADMIDDRVANRTTTRDRLRRLARPVNKLPAELELGPLEVPAA